MPVSRARSATDRRLKDHKEVLVVVRVDSFTVIAKVFSTVHAAEPFAMYALHTPITYSGCVPDVAEVF